MYNSNPALVPPQKTFVKDSEYAAQFKQYNAIPVSSDDLKAIPRAEKPRSKVKCQLTINFHLKFKYLEWSDYIVSFEINDLILISQWRINKWELLPVVCYNECF